MKNKYDFKLEYQNCLGKWQEYESLDVEEFLLNILKFNKFKKIETIEQAVYSLKSGNKLRNDHDDWYSNFRIKEGYTNEKHIAVEMVKCSCGHTVQKTLVMHASLGSSCDDCYDDMSD